MTQSLLDDIAELQTLLRDVESAGGGLAPAIKRIRRRLPRRVYKQGMLLADALPLLEHPKLRMTVDEAALKGAAREVKAHLKSVDLADRRKGRLLDILASMAFSILAVIFLLVVALRWRGLI